MNIDFQFSGGREIALALQELGKRGGKDATAMRDGLAAGARIWRKTIRDNIRAMGLKRQGLLIKDVKIQKKRFRSSTSVGVSVISANPISHILEYGTMPRYRGLGNKKSQRKYRQGVARTRVAKGIRTGYTGIIRPYGFMRKSFMEDRETVLKKISTETWKYIDKQTKKLRAKHAAQ